MGLEARAESLPMVFEQMAFALVALVYGKVEHASSRHIEIQVSAEDLVELLISWLNEIVYLMERDEIVPTHFTISQVSEHELHAVTHAVPFEPTKHVVERQVKSVTYHQASVRMESGCWCARVFVDL